MNRYFYYPVIMCMLTNTILFVPSILIGERFNGAVSSMLLSVVIGSTLAFVFTKSILAFPGQGLPDILDLYFPKSIRAAYVLFLVIMWFSAGGMVLVSYCRILQRFVNPDFNLFILIGFLGIVCAWTATNNSRTVLYITEIVLVLNLPFICFIFFKAITRETMDWDAVRVIAHYWFVMPSWKSLAAGTYLFTGYVNWVIFNRSVRVDNKLRQMWVIPVVGAMVLLTSFLIPIGYNGTYGVDHHIYIWISTADAMRMEFGFIERVLFFFLLLYLSIALLFISVTWHVGNELVKAIVPQRLQPFLQNYPNCWSFGILLAIGFATELSALWLNEKKYMQFASIWFQLRLFTEVLLAVTLYWLRKRNEYK